MTSPTPEPEETDFLALAREIWLKPRETIRTIVDYDPRYLQRGIVLALSAGSALLALRDGPMFMALEFILNYLLWIASIFGTALLLWLTGKPLGGKATFQELVAALTWSMIPALLGLLFAFAMRLAGGAFDTNADIMQLLLYLYSFHLMVFTTAEVQGFSYWKSVLNQFLVLLVMIIPVILFMNVIMQFVGKYVPLPF